jgi:hypothetical protein
MGLSLKGVLVAVDAAGTKTVLCRLGWSWRSWRDVERYFLCSRGIAVAQDVHCLIRTRLRKGSIGMVMMI